MAKDSILSQVGDFGLYQKLLCGIFVFYTTFLCGLNYYTQVRSVIIPHLTSYFWPGLHLPHAGAPVFRLSAGLSAGPARGQLGGSPALDTQTQGIPQVRK